MDTTYVKSGQPFETVIEGAPTGLAGVIGVRLLDNVGGTVIARTIAGILENPPGSGAYTKVMTAPIVDGQYRALWDTDPGGVATPTNSASQDVVVTSSATVTVLPDPDQSAESVGVCQLWTSADAVWLRMGETLPAPSEMARYVEWASGLLYQLSGRRFAGVCERTVRPCRVGCSCWAPAVWGQPLTSWGWDGGMWRAQGNDGAGIECGCGVLSRVRLPYPARSVLSVKIDGVTVDPATYRIDSQLWLTRMQGAGGWPACQHLDAPGTAAGTFEVVLSYGAVPPVAGAEAAVALAAQLWKLHNPGAGACALPAGVTQIVRNGLTMTKTAVAAWQEGKTGVAEIDSFLAAYNPNGRRGRARAWSPDTPLPARKVGT